MYTYVFSGLGGIRGFAIGLCTSCSLRKRTGRLPMYQGGF